MCYVIFAVKEGLACLREVGDAQHKTDGVQDIGFPAAIEPRDGIKEWVKVWHIHARCVGLEALEGYLLNVHPALLSLLSVHPHSDAVRAAKGQYRIRSAEHVSDSVFAALAVLWVSPASRSIQQDVRAIHTQLPAAGYASRTVKSLTIKCALYASSPGLIVPGSSCV